MCAFGHISYYWTMYSFCACFSISLKYPNKNTPKIHRRARARTHMRKITKGNENKEKSMSSLFASHSSQNHFVNIFVIPFFQCSLDSFSVFGCYCRCRNYRCLWCCLSIVCSTYWPTAQSECEHKRRSRKLKTHMLFAGNGYVRRMYVDVCVCVCVGETMSGQCKECGAKGESVEKSLRDQLNSRLNDVDGFDDDNRCVHFYLHFCSVACYCFCSPSIITSLGECGWMRAYFTKIEPLGITNRSKCLSSKM